MAWLWAVVGLLGGLALVGVVWSWRGRRAGLALHCRWCGFDLTGTAGAGEPGEAECPECGRGVGRASAVQRGVRKRRPVIGAFSAAVLLLVVGVVGLRIAASTSYAAMVAWTPTPMLMWVYQSDDVVRDELIARLTTGGLSQPTVDAIVAHALAKQANAAVPWNPAWGEAIEKAWDAGQLSQADMEAYLLGGVSLEVRVRPRVQKGRAPDVEGWGSDARYGSMKAEASWVWQALTIDGEPIGAALPRSVSSRGGQPDGRFELAAGQHHSGSSSHIDPSPLGETLGTFVVEGEAIVTVTQTGPIPPANPASPWRPMAATGPVTAQSATVDVVAESTGNYGYAEMLTLLLANRAGVWLTYNVNAAGNHEKMLTLGLAYPHLVQDFELWVRTGDQWVDITDSASWDNLDDGPYIASWSLARLQRRLGRLPATMTMVWRVNIDRAETTAEMDMPWWPGELWFEDVRLDAQAINLDKVLRPLRSAWWDPELLHRQSPSLVEPMARVMTIEEAEAEPVWPPPKPGVIDEIDDGREAGASEEGDDVRD
ncbi:MAG: hypothetical protein AAGK09_06810 [Planctomycetota bacterium]